MQTGIFMAAISRSLRHGATSRPHAMTDTLYWDDIGAAWVQKRPQRLWRDFADRHQFSLVARWFQSQDGDAIGSHQDAACNRAD